MESRLFCIICSKPSPTISTGSVRMLRPKPKRPEALVSGTVASAANSQLSLCADQSLRWHFSPQYHVVTSSSRFPEQPEQPSGLSVRTLHFVQASPTPSSRRYAFFACGRTAPGGTQPTKSGERSRWRSRICSASMKILISGRAVRSRGNIFLRCAGSSPSATCSSTVHSEAQRTGGSFTLIRARTAGTPPATTKACTKSRLSVSSASAIVVRPKTSSAMTCFFGPKPTSRPGLGPALRMRVSTCAPPAAATALPRSASPKNWSARLPLRCMFSAPGCASIAAHTGRTAARASSIARSKRALVRSNCATSVERLEKMAQTLACTPTAVLCTAMACATASSKRGALGARICISAASWRNRALTMKVRPRMKPALALLLRSAAIASAMMPAAMSASTDCLNTEDGGLIPSFVMTVPPIPVSICSGGHASASVVVIAEWGVAAERQRVRRAGSCSSKARTHRLPPRNRFRKGAGRQELPARWRTCALL
eukprot:scaffold11663_cov73-Phaeocystis_antarctica.AAC.3